MKTAIQELIEIVDMDYQNGVEISMKAFYMMLKKAMVKEKEQIQDAFITGMQKNPFQTGESYYYSTFID